MDSSSSVVWEEVDKLVLWSDYDRMVIERYCKLVRECWKMIGEWSLCDWRSCNGVWLSDGSVYGVSRRVGNGDEIDGRCLGGGIWVVVDDSVGGVVCEVVNVSWECDRWDVMGKDEIVDCLDDENLSEVSKFVLNWMLKNNIRIGKEEKRSLWIPRTCISSGERVWDVFDKEFRKVDVNGVSDWKKFEESWDRGWKGCGKLILERRSGGRELPYILAHGAQMLYDECWNRSDSVEWRRRVGERMRELGVNDRGDVVFKCFVDSPPGDIKELFE